MPNRGVVIVEDQPDIREFLGWVLKGRWEVIGEAASVTEALQIIPELKEIQPPPIVILDGSFPHSGDGDIVAAVLRSEIPGIRILGYSAANQTYGDINLHKPAEIAEILKAVQTLADQALAEA